MSDESFAVSLIRDNKRLGKKFTEKRREKKKRLNFVTAAR